MTIKQVLIGAALGSSIVGLMVHRLRKEKIANTHPAQVASLKKFQAQKKHTGPSESELSSRKPIG